MSDVAQGPGWWQASDGRWYPPETLAQALAQAGAVPATAGPGPGEAASGPGEAAARLGGAATGPGEAATWPEPEPGPGPGPGEAGPGAGAAAAHGATPTGAVPPGPYAPAGQPPGFPPYGAGPGPGVPGGAQPGPMAPYPWPAYAAYPTWRRNRLIGALLVVLGLAGVVWGIGELYAAMALNSSPVYPHDEQVGAWLLTAGILLASLVTVAIGFAYRRD